MAAATGVVAPVLPELRIPLPLSIVRMTSAVRVPSVRPIMFRSAYPQAAKRGAVIEQIPGFPL